MEPCLNVYALNENDFMNKSISQLKKKLSKIIALIGSDEFNLNN